MTGGLDALAGVGLAVGSAVAAHNFNPRTSSRAWLIPIIAMMSGAAYLLVGLWVRSVPELTGQEVITLDEGPGYTIVSVTGWRHTDCIWQGNTAEVKQGGTVYAAGVTYLGPRIGNRSPGFHVLGPRRLDYPEHVTPDQVRFFSRYRCGVWFKEEDSGWLDL